MTLKIVHIKKNHKKDCTSNAGGVGSILGQGTKILYSAQLNQNPKPKSNKTKQKLRAEGAAVTHTLHSLPIPQHGGLSQFTG